MSEFTVKFTAYGKFFEKGFRGRTKAQRFADDMDTLYDDVRVTEGDRVVYEPALWDDDGRPRWCGADHCRHCQGHTRGPPQSSPCPKLGEFA